LQLIKWAKTRERIQDFDESPEQFDESQEALLDENQGALLDIKD